jgi:hypothetical protein
VVPVLWVKETAAGPLCVMEPPRGEALRERLAQGPLPVAAVLRLGIEIAEALAALHYHGVVHRGVGPRAIRLAADGSAQLADFTFAKDGRSGGMSSLQHGVVQKALLDCMPEYSAPEQMAGSGSEPRSDLYALGCTLYYCLTGVDAFAGDGNHEAGGDRFGALRDLPKGLVTALRSCTRPSKLERFSTGQQLADALRRVQAELAAAGSSVGRVGRQGLGKWVGGFTGLAAVLLLAMSLWPQSGGARDGDVLDAPASADTDARAKKVYSGNYRAVHGLLVAIGEGYAIHGIKRKLNTPRADAEAIRERLRRNDEAGGAMVPSRSFPTRKQPKHNFLADLTGWSAKRSPKMQCLYILPVMPNAMVVPLVCVPWMPGPRLKLAWVLSRASDFGPLVIAVPPSMYWWCWIVAIRARYLT